VQQRCAVCGLDHGVTHSCSGIGPPLTAEEAMPPPPGIAPLYYLNLALRIVRWDDVAVRRAARDPDSTFYGAVFSAMAAAIIFLATALPRMLGDPNRTPGKLGWELALGLPYVWLTLGVLAFVQLGLCHLVAKWFFGAKGTFVGVMRPLLLGWFVNVLMVIPVLGSYAAAIGWTAVLMLVFEEADGIERMQAFLISAGINVFFLALQLMVAKP
jgi:hypothetical protein